RVTDQIDAPALDAAVDLPLEGERQRLDRSGGREVERVLPQVARQAQIGLERVEVGAVTVQPVDEDHGPDVLLPRRTVSAREVTEGEQEPVRQERQALTNRGAADRERIEFGAHAKRWAIRRSESIERAELRLEPSILLGSSARWS